MPLRDDREVGEQRNGRLSLGDVKGLAAKPEMEASLTLLIKVRSLDPSGVPKHRSQPQSHPCQKNLLSEIIRGGASSIPYKRPPCMLSTTEAN